MHFQVQLLQLFFFLYTFFAHKNKATIERHPHTWGFPRVSVALLGLALNWCLTEYTQTFIGMKTETACLVAWWTPHTVWSSGLAESSVWVSLLSYVYLWKTLCGTIIKSTSENFMLTTDKFNQDCKFYWNS